MCGVNMLQLVPKMKLGFEEWCKSTDILEISGILLRVGFLLVLHKVVGTGPSLQMNLKPSWNQDIQQNRQDPKVLNMDVFVWPKHTGWFGSSIKTSKDADLSFPWFMSPNSTIFLVPFIYLHPSRSKIIEVILMKIQGLSGLWTISGLRSSTSRFLQGLHQKSSLWVSWGPLLGCLSSVLENVEWFVMSSGTN